LAGLPTSLLPPVYQAQAYAYPIEWLLLGITVGVLLSIALYHLNIFQRVLLVNALRTGGFITAGYLALFVNRPADLLFVIVCSGITYLIVTRYLMKKAILFGRSKMAAMFFTGFIVTSLAEVAIAVSGVNYVPWAGFTAITPAIVALLANDAQRQGPQRTFIGVGIATVAVFIVMLAVSIVHNWW
jgi:hypothetical protein